jgi:hypothetical protein
MAILGGPFVVIRRLSLVLTPAILAAAAIGGSSVAAGETRSFVLGADPAAVVDGHHYEVLAVDLPSTELFRVSLRSTEVDSFLTLVAPDQALHDDDQSGGDNDALVEIAAPAPGRWLIVATTFDAGETGKVELALDPGTVDDDAVVSLPEALTATIIAGRDDRAEARLRAGPMARQAADIERLAGWLGEAFRRDQVEAIISDKSAKLEAERERLRADLDVAEAALADDAEPDQATPVDPTPAGAAGEVELLQDALAEIDTLQLGLEAASGALDEIAALAAVIAGGDGVQQVIQELVAETKAQRDGFASIDAMAVDRRETLAWRLVASDIVVIDEDGPVASAYGPAPRNPMIDPELYVDEAARGIGNGVEEAIVAGPESLGDDDALAALLPGLHPWPPPVASARMVLPRTLIDPDNNAELTLGDVDRRLTAALAEAGYAGHGYSGVPGGFAIVTPVERFLPDGSPLDPTSRWSTKLPPLRSFSLGEYIRALFTAESGHFRVLLFIVTDQPFHSDAGRARLSTVETWARQGVNTLPTAVEDQDYTRAHNTTVLVYEFEKVRGSGVSQVVLEEQVMNAPDHLKSSGILPALGGS